MSSPLSIVVRYRAGAHVAAAEGKRASCTHSPELAARGLAFKIWPEAGEVEVLQHDSQPGDEGSSRRFTIAPKAGKCVGADAFGAHA